LTWLDLPGEKDQVPPEPVWPWRRPARCVSRVQPQFTATGNASRETDERL